jgi:hypothetical protein
LHDDEFEALGDADGALDLETGPVGDRLRMTQSIAAGPNSILPAAHNESRYTAWIAFVTKVAWVIVTIVPSRLAVVSTVAPSCWASALMMPVPRPVFG